MKNIWLVGFLITIVLITGCASQQGIPERTQPAPTLTTTPAEKKVLTEQPVPIEIKDYKYDPATIMISKGTAVIWINEDTAPHTATIKTGTGFDSGTLSHENTFSYRFNATGIFDYGCSFHPGMSGRIIVQ